MLESPRKIGVSPKHATPRRGVSSAVLLAFALSAILGVGCSPTSPPRPPSILLVVFDTTRADAISAYGAVEGTTPVFDALAEQGLLYRRAYANASWTLPSHASLLTGLLPSEHGVSWRNTMASQDLLTLAERFRDAGYDTAGFTENAWIGNSTELNQGFETFGLVWRASKPLVDQLSQWVRTRDDARPYFLFLNFTDAHRPYELKEDLRFLPEGVVPDEARLIDQGRGTYICQTTGKERDLETLFGIYLAGVAEADEKLGRVLTILADAGMNERLVTVVTSDHGDHFGEDDLFEHVIGVNEPLIHIPLLVHGLPGVEPAKLDQTVQLASISASLIDWAGLARGDVPIMPPLPIDGAGSGTDPVSEWVDPSSPHVPDPSKITKVGRLSIMRDRSRCNRRGRTYGNMRSLIEYPYKLTSYDNYPPQLHDLRDPASTRRDLSQVQPEVVDRMLATLQARIPKEPLFDAIRSDAPPEPSREVEESLRALGYLGDEDE